MHDVIIRTHQAAYAALLALAVTAASPSIALAGPHGPGPVHGPGPAPRHHSPAYLAVAPVHAVAVMVDGVRYLYDAGIFYHKRPAGYAVVAAPVGAMVPALPPAHTVTVVDGTTYYVHGGTYYLPAHPGYVVAAPPVVVQAAPVTSQGTGTGDMPAEVTLVIDNPNGSRTPVTLKRVTGGWQGPKGEIYPALPTQEQLAPYYGLNSTSQTL